MGKFSTNLAKKYEAANVKRRGVTLRPGPHAKSTSSRIHVDKDRGTSTAGKSQGYEPYVERRTPTNASSKTMLAPEFKQDDFPVKPPWAIRLRSRALGAAAATKRAQQSNDVALEEEVVHFKT